jgi:hypothetical protein
VIKNPNTKTKFTVTGDLETPNTFTYDWMTQVSFAENEVQARNIIENAL